MRTEQIIARVTEIANDGCCAVYTDGGNGCGGPGVADATALRDMLGNGAFAGARVAESRDLEHANADREEVFATVGMQDDPGTDWLPIVCGQIDGDTSSNPYYMVMWIWG